MLLAFVAPPENAETVVSPFAVLVTVTVLPLAVAVVPTAEKEVLQALIVAARFVARSEAAAAVIKVPAAELEQLCVPFVPPVTLLHEKMLELFAARTENPETVKSPLVVFVTVTVFVLALALTPAA